MFAGDRDRSRIHNPCTTITVSSNAHYAASAEYTLPPARATSRRNVVSCAAVGARPSPVVQIVNAGACGWALNEGNPP